MRKVAPGVFLLLAFGAGFATAWRTAYDAGMRRMIGAKPLPRRYYTSEAAWRRAELERQSAR